MPDSIGMPILLTILVLALVVFKLRGMPPGGPRGPFSD